MSKKQKIIIFLLVLLNIAVGLRLYYVYTEQKQSSLETTSGSAMCKDCNVIMISLANVSAEHMSLYGYERLTTPNFDAWAQDAFVFENAFTQSSWTLPVATSLFTSLYPYSHKVAERHSENVLDSRIETLPEILRDRGYKTAAFTGGLDYNGKFGHMRGFQQTEEATASFFAATFAGFDATLDKASSWLKENAGGKFFLFLHGYDAHCPFDPPDKFKGVFSSTDGKDITVDNTLCLRGYRNSKDGSYKAYYFKETQQSMTLTEDDITYLEDLYDEEVLSVDELVGSFIRNLEETTIANTIVVIFSDHGEMFAKRGRFGRAGAVRGTLYDDVVYVPLIMRIPNQIGARVDGLVQLIDVMPTLLDILGMPESEQAQGKSLLPLLGGKRQEVNDYVFAGSKFGRRIGSRSFTVYPVQSVNESIRNKEWKLIHEVKYGVAGSIEEDTYELYDLKNDPDELHNILASQPSVAAELKKVLLEWKTEAENSGFQVGSSPRLLPPKILQQAKERGYQ